jgi:hypothetical protein
LFVTPLKVSVILLTLLCRPQSATAVNRVAQDGAAQSQGVALPDGTEFTVATTADISSKTVKGGDQLSFQVDEDVTLDGRVLIAKGTPAKGSVVSAVRSARFGEGGWLGIRVESTTAVDGTEVKIRATKSREGDDKFVSTAALSMLVGPVAFLRRGDEAFIKAGTRIKVYSDSARPDGMATVYIYRTKKFYGESLRPSVYRDKVKLARIENGSYLALKVEPGRHAFHMHDKGGVEVELKEGQEYYLQVEVMYGVFKGHGEIRQAKAEDGAAAIKKLRLLEGKSAPHEQE